MAVKALGFSKAVFWRVFSREFFAEFLEWLDSCAEFTFDWSVY